MFRTWLIAALATLSMLPAAAPAAKDSARTQARLEAIKAEIERVRNQVNRDQVQRDRITRELQESEVSASNLRLSLDELRQARAEQAERRAALAAQKREHEAALVQEREALAGQLRAAYLIGHEEPLKLLLNQKDPARAGRMFAYYSYFGRARADRIERIAEHVRSIEQLEGQLEAQDQKLAALEARRREQLTGLDAARARRGAVLASLDEQTRSRARALERLKQEQAGLEKLMRELKRAVERFPIDSNDAFARLRGKLAWPVDGRVVARFGQTRAGGVKWDGVLLATERGAPVHAVYHGRIVYADWLPGLGLLTIVDHGDGYMSLYGHNDRLYKSVGEQVTAGDPIAAAGDSGGRDRTEVYFEIRKGGRPVNPAPWFKSGTPAP